MTTKMISSEGTLKLISAEDNSTLLNSYSVSAWILGNITANSIATKWLTWASKNPASKNNNMKATAYMLDTKAWSSFTNSTYADYTIEGPTIELYCASYKDYTSR